MSYTLSKCISVWVMFNHTCILTSINLSEQGVELDAAYMFGLALSISCLIIYGTLFIFHLNNSIRQVLNLLCYCLNWSVR